MAKVNQAKVNMTSAAGHRYLPKTKLGEVVEVQS